jgi:hypothetical protein
MNSSARIFAEMHKLMVRIGIGRFFRNQIQSFHIGDAESKLLNMAPCEGNMERGERMA